MNTLFLYCNGFLITVTKCEEHEIGKIISQYMRQCRSDYEETPLSMSYKLVLN